MPEFRNCVWDTRRASEGVIVPCDFTARPVTEWNCEWLREELKDYADQEAVSHMCDGADLKAGIALQYCFSPHLLSLTADYMTAFNDLMELKRLGFCEWFEAFAFCPCRINGQGLREKPGDGPLAWRRIASGSAPYEEMLDSDGVPTCSINDDARKPDRAIRPGVAFRRWRKAMVTVMIVLVLGGKAASVKPATGYLCKRFRKEWKPRVTHVMHDTTIQRAIADHNGVSLRYFIDDFWKVTDSIQSPPDSAQCPPQDHSESLASDALGVSTK